MNVVFSEAPSDVLDHATGEIASGSKRGIDATKKLPGEDFKRPWPPLIKMDVAVKAKMGKLFGGIVCTRDAGREQPQAHASQLSLAVFKPMKVLDFIWEQDEQEWDQSKVDQMRSNADQGELFSADTWRQTFKLMPKLPFKFSYRFEDADRKQSEMQVLDWETGQHFGNAAAPPTVTNEWRCQKFARNTWINS